MVFENLLVCVLSPKRVLGWGSLDIYIYIEQNAGDFVKEEVYFVSTSLTLKNVAMVRSQCDSFFRLNVVSYFFRCDLTVHLQLLPLLFAIL